MQYVYNLQIVYIIVEVLFLKKTRQVCRNKTFLFITRNWTCDLLPHSFSKVNKKVLITKSYLWTGTFCIHVLSQGIVWNSEASIFWEAYKEIWCVTGKWYLRGWVFGTCGKITFPALKNVVPYLYVYTFLCFSYCWRIRQCVVIFTNLWNFSDLYLEISLSDLRYLLPWCIPNYVYHN